MCGLGGFLGGFADAEVIVADVGDPIAEGEEAVGFSFEGMGIMVMQEELAVEIPAQMLAFADDLPCVSLIADDFFFSRPTATIDALVAFVISAIAVVFTEAVDDGEGIVPTAMNEDITRSVKASVGEKLDLDITVIFLGVGVKFDDDIAGERFGEE